MACVPPASAQDDSGPVIDCVFEEAGPTLRNSLVNEFLSERGFGEQGRDSEEQFHKVYTACLDANDVPDKAAGEFIDINLSYLMSIGLGERLTGIGYDLTLLDLVLAEYLRDADLDTTEYLVANSDTLIEPLIVASLESDTAFDLALTLLGAYVGSATRHEVVAAKLLQE